ncbi:hypothetical protein CBM2589_U10152 [Cupriavidus taiwanensis]|uniref:Uncharacterized protein n=1 Tax=Cupriavidus taiwanensis TaxID=164546 RepID=A0A375CQE3_9BURK|nr:hypothetical protein [Cupriavidus taiwanensis]SOY77642.1 hypothetical protein CBM2589_U10152 [Cupriavidus taiwanensis]
MKQAVTVSGNVNLQTAETSIIAGKVKIAEIKNSAGQLTPDLAWYLGQFVFGRFKGAVAQ